MSLLRVQSGLYQETICALLQNVSRKITGFHTDIPAERGVSLGAAVQLGTVHLGWIGRLLFWWRRRVCTAQKTLPHGFLRERLRATFLDQSLHDLMLCVHGAKDSPASHLAVGSLCTVTAVQTWLGGKDKLVLGKYNISIHLSIFEIVFSEVKMFLKGWTWENHSANKLHS